MERLVRPNSAKWVAKASKHNPMPRVDALVAAETRIYKSGKRNIPTAATKINTDPVSIKTAVIYSFISILNFSSQIISKGDGG